MSFVDHKACEINFKIVYYGPDLSGKATNLQHIHRKLQPAQKSQMHSMTDMALFFSLLTRTFSLIDGLRPRFHLYAPPGPFTYEYQLYDLVKGADGIVFVADSQAVRCGDNVESLTDLEHQLAGHGRELRKIPLVIQYNKRDLPQTLPVTELDALLPGYECPRFEAVAVVGSGVFETLRTITQAVVAPLQGVDSTGSGQ